MKMYEKTNDFYKEIDLWQNTTNDQNCNLLQFVWNSFMDILFGVK
jgi:hypothetical protein